MEILSGCWGGCLGRCGAATAVSDCQNGSIIPTGNKSTNTNKLLLCERRRSRFLKPERKSSAAPLRRARHTFNEMTPPPEKRAGELLSTRGGGQNQPGSGETEQLLESNQEGDGTNERSGENPRVGMTARLERRSKSLFKEMIKSRTNKLKLKRRMATRPGIVYLTCQQASISPIFHVINTVKGRRYRENPAQKWAK